ncbi:MAG: acyl-ACP--UDP-N-acetylglucosamine O-acyltransferase [Holophagales bacterium]|nr:acyl-ACP--UDP-N-acetylglucosamine O-acyltransferase [Holophagales bacterium]
MGKHHMALVDPGAQLGTGLEIGPFAVVEAETAIGDGCELGAHSVVKRFTRMGARNRVHEGAILGGEPQDLGFGGGPSHLEIGDDNRIREGVTIHRATAPGGVTRVGSGCFLMAYSHVAHEDVIGDHVILANNVALAGHVRIDERAFLSGGVVVHQFCRVGRLAMVGGNTKVIKDCLPFVITDGVPARARGLNVVGLRRAGFAASQLRTLKEAYRLLLRSGLSLAEALERLTALGDPLADELGAFVRDSKRGFHRASRETDLA